MILEGSVRISKQIPGVGEEALAVLKSGTYFGEMALIDGKPRSADAIANDAVTVYSIDATAFHNLLRTDPDLSYHILMQFVRTLARRLRDTNERIRSFLAFAAFG
jgi:CRP-like cAMP-binding protein